MADPMFLSVLERRTIGKAARVLRLPDESVSPGMVSSIASPPGGLSEFFLKGTKPAAAAKSNRLAIPASETTCMLPASETIPECTLESRLLALVRNPGATWMASGKSTPSHATAPRKAGRELAHRNARNSSDHSESQRAHWSV
jgi:hypothetical protein